MRRMEYLRTDPNVSFDDQLNSDHQGPVILISLYSAPEEQMDALLKGWTERAEMMLKQPGLISVQMHRGIAGASILASYVVWESLEACRAGQALTDGHDDLEKIDLTSYPAQIGRASCRDRVGQDM